MYTVSREFTFCYGHRLCGYSGNCAQLHGHNALVRICIESETLDDNGFVVDFSLIQKKISQWIDQNLDHKMILYKNDPFAACLHKIGAALYLTENNPSAENLAKLIYQEASKSFSGIKKVEFWETPKSCATYGR